MSISDEVQRVVEHYQQRTKTAKEQNEVLSSETNGGTITEETRTLKALSSKIAALKETHAVSIQDLANVLK